MGHASLVVLAAVDQKIVRVCSEVADVAEQVASDRVASAGWFVAGTLIPVITNIDKREFSGLFRDLLLGVRFCAIFLDESQLRSGGEESIPHILELASR